MGCLDYVCNGQCFVIHTNTPPVFLTSQTLSRSLYRSVHSYLQTFCVIDDHQYIYTLIRYTLISIDSSLIISEIIPMFKDSSNSKHSLRVRFRPRMVLTNFRRKSWIRKNLHFSGLLVFEGVCICYRWETFYFFILKSQELHIILTNR